MSGNLEYYKVFYYVERLGSITGAAQILCISQPAVSQAVRQLEQNLGVKLFIRSAKGVRLTEEGKTLAAYVERGMESFLKGEEAMDRLKNLEIGDVRIGASDMTLRFYLLPYLERFHEEYPGIHVNVSNGPTPETIGLLEQGDIDFAVVSTPFELTGGFQARPVKTIRNVFVAGNHFSHLRGKKLDYSCLLHYPCIFLEKKTSTRAFMDAFLAERGIFPKPEFDLAISDMVVQFAIRNLGIGCIEEEFAQTALEKGEVFRLEFEEEMPERQFCLVTGRRELISIPGRRMLEMMERETEGT
ncbi:MAG TPA: LysR family transcriptional regulator [Candidatus Lachnoclostridium pullistercoris]|uniref:LysR family transcriptional regulator n=1 Tax=Candidatus Lachnoclostridium pullistercoris TaxID=2838632 RepID=A0A9D2T5H3_9FIRM|nr:LysR family transcriptional regulator [Candidatus Lachnoclostridium pullistercoris]